MLTLPPSVRVYVAAEPTDLRKSFDGLSILVGQDLGHDQVTTLHSFGSMAAGGVPGGLFCLTAVTPPQ